VKSVRGLWQHNDLSFSGINTFSTGKLSGMGKACDHFPIPQDVECWLISVVSLGLLCVSTCLMFSVRPREGIRIVNVAHLQPPREHVWVDVIPPPGQPEQILGALIAPKDSESMAGTTPESPSSCSKSEISSSKSNDSASRARMLAPRADSPATRPPTPRRPRGRINPCE